MARPSISERVEGKGDPRFVQSTRIAVNVLKKDLGAFQDTALRGRACTHPSWQIWRKKHRSLDHSLTRAGEPGLVLIAKRFLNEESARFLRVGSFIDDRGAGPSNEQEDQAGKNDMDPHQRPPITAQKPRPSAL
jgi:hypothetical protein